MRHADTARLLRLLASPCPTDDWATCPKCLTLEAIQHNDPLIVQLLRLAADALETA